jgi:hypothetical protein
MKRYWSEVTFLLDVLVTKTWNIDPDGVELMFTQGPVKIPDESRREERLRKRDTDEKKRILDAFKAAMKNPEAVPATSKTDMSVKLRQILFKWIEDFKKDRKFSRTKRNLTILVLTDGRWTGMERRPLAVDQTIIDFHDELKQTMGGFRPERPLSISFISFGHDSDAIFRLERLDKGLGEAGVP